jgi:subtilisin family serine protease
MVARRRSARKERSSGPVPQDVSISEPELILVARPTMGLKAMGDKVTSICGADVSPLAGLIESEGISIRPLFGASEEKMRAQTALFCEEAYAPVPDLSVYYKVEAPVERLDHLANELRKLEAVEAAYVKPPVEIAYALRELFPLAEEAPAKSSDFTSRQLYLDAAPVGVDARYSWTVPGGKGQGVKIIDIEGAWNFSHEDLAQNQGGVVGGTPAGDLGWRNHGTAVVGEFSGDCNDFGITGICPDANVRAISVFGGMDSAAAIRKAAEMLDAGDIILIELHRAGPRFNFQDRADQRGYIAVEWWPDDLDAIRYAIGKGVIVIEAAGNGGEDLDDALYDNNPSSPNGPFPSGWHNPFKRNPIDSGAILVGAGNPPAGTHGRNTQPNSGEIYVDRARCSFSNYGALIDAQGWGWEVTSCGYGDLQGGTIENFWYTDQFSGTSSASPILVGTIGCIQGILKVAGKAALTPAEARGLLRTTGSPQQDAPGRPISQRIGNRPNLREMINQVLPKPATKILPLYRYWNPTTNDHFYTTNWAELGEGKYGWKFESIQCYVIPAKTLGMVPLFRYWNANAGTHFYTTNWAELGGGKYDWKYEGVQCYVFPVQMPGTVPLYRYWNTTIGTHFFTTNWAELGDGKCGWKYEGIQCYVCDKPNACISPISEASTSAPGVEEKDGGNFVPEILPPQSSGLLGGPESFISTGIDGISFGISDIPESFKFVKSKTFKGITININLNLEKD